MRTIVVTGGAGFIGSHFVHHLLETYPDVDVRVLDKLTYAGNLENLAALNGHPRYSFTHGDICDAATVDAVCQGAWAIVNFAAETHVDRSILSPGSFIQTDVYGTYILLEAARTHGVARFHQISTDEVYGSVPEGHSLENDRLEPRSPYSASKAGGEMLVQAYHVTYGLPTIITRGSNNYGPNQYPEKIIPLFVTNAIDDLPLPLYGDGGALRDYLYVRDHCTGVDMALHHGTPGEIYNVGAGVEVSGRTIAETVLRLVGKSANLIQYVRDRPGHDRRYSVDCSRLKALGWQPEWDMERGLRATVDWYQTHESWWRRLKDASFQEYYKQNYHPIGQPA